MIRNRAGLYRHLVVLYAFCSRKLITLRRYPLNFGGMVASRLILFLLLFIGGTAVAPTQLGNSIEAVIVGYFLFTVATSTFFNLETMINTEAKYGTLEQLYVSPFSFMFVLFSAVIANILISLGLGTVTLAFALFVTGQALTIDLLTIVPILVLTLLDAIGLSFLLGGIALLFKRVRSMFKLIDLVFIVMISFAMTGLLWPKLLPVGQGAWMLHEAMSNGTRLGEFSVIDHGFLLGTAIVYLAIGFLSFYLCQHRARQRGLLDDY